MSKKGGAPNNLKPVRTKEEAKKRGKNGGIKSGEARRKKRDAKQAAKMILDLPASNQLSKNLESLGVKEEDFTNRVALFARAYVKAVAGDVTAMRFIIEMAGETPHYQLEKQRFDNEVDKQAGNNNAVDDWVNNIPEIEVKE